MCILSGREDPIMSYDEFKRGGWCEIACAHFFVDGQLERLETLLNNLLSFVDVHVAKMRGSSSFSEL
jgi:hypothetical protein